MATSTDLLLTEIRLNWRDELHKMSYQKIETLASWIVPDVGEWMSPEKTSINQADLRLGRLLQRNTKQIGIHLRLLEKSRRVTRFATGMPKCKWVVQSDHNGVSCICSRVSIVLECKQAHVTQSVVCDLSDTIEALCWVIASFDSLHSFVVDGQWRRRWRAVNWDP